MFSTITAQFPGVCRRCRHDIRPGDRVRYGGPGRLYHLKADCDGTAATTEATPCRRELSRTCPTCKRPNALTYDEARKGYQCHACTMADEGPGAPEMFFGPPD